MPEPMDTQHYTGPHPTCREFVTQLTMWGFTPRKEERVHTVFRGPRGGTVRVIRSQLGRADPAMVDKAARLADVTPAQFWDGPQPQVTPEPSWDTTRARAAGRKSAAHDSIISLVLAVHAETDRPLGFDQVVELSGNRVTRAQVSAASAALCRGGQLDRIRSGVYQWAAGQRAAVRQVPQSGRTAVTVPQHREPTEPSAHQPRRMRAAELFSQLFPSGVQMTGELLADLEQWARLTSKLTAAGPQHGADTLTGS